MHQTSEMISANPSRSTIEVDLLAECIEACMVCSQVNIACADACLGEPNPQELAHCIRLNLDCADICTATERVVSRQHKPDTELLRLQMQACVQACQVCAVECEAHQSEHEHCRVCAEQCRRTEQVCRQTLEQFGAAGRATQTH